MIKLTSLTTNQLRQILAIKEQIETLQSQIDSIAAGGGEITIPVAEEAPTTRRRRVSAAGVGISPPAIDWIWLCSVSICSLMARTWRSWFVVKLVSLVMAEFVMLVEVLSQSRKWPISVTGGRGQWPSRFDFTVGDRSYTNTSMVGIAIRIKGSTDSHFPPARPQPIRGM